MHASGAHCQHNDAMNLLDRELHSGLLHLIVVGTALYMYMHTMSDSLQRCNYMVHVANFALVIKTGFS